MTKTNKNIFLKCVFIFYLANFCCKCGDWDVIWKWEKRFVNLVAHYYYYAQDHLDRAQYSKGGEKAYLIFSFNGHCPFQRYNTLYKEFWEVAVYTLFSFFF